MRHSVTMAMLGVVVAGTVATGQAPRPARLNPVIELIEQKKPVFGLYAPSNRRFGPQGAAPATPAKSPYELAKEALDYRKSDFVFDGSMEEGVEKNLPAFAELVKAMGQIGVLSRTPAPRLHHPLIVKMEEIAPNPTKAVAAIGQQLNLGVSGIMFVTVESADEVTQGLAAMRFKAQGGTRSADVGSAPAFWGMSEQEYRQRADLWPLNPDGELINWTIIESKQGLARVREIAAVKGIGVLWPGAGTLRGVFSTKNAAGERVVDEAAWEAAIQQVLAACKEFNVACGYPANANDVEMRMKQGFSVFVAAWGDNGFKTIDAGRKVAAR